MKAGTPIYDSLVSESGIVPDPDRLDDVTELRTATAVWVQVGWLRAGGITSSIADSLQVVTVDHVTVLEPVPSLVSDRPKELMSYDQGTPEAGQAQADHRPDPHSASPGWPQAGTVDGQATEPQAPAEAPAIAQASTPDAVVVMAKGPEPKPKPPKKPTGRPRPAPGGGVKGL